MKAFKEFEREDKSFWFLVRFVSEKLGYSDKKTSTIKIYSYEDIEALCNREGISVSPDKINQVVKYCRMRAELINNEIEKNLMDAEEAESVFESVRSSGSYKTKFILNKQSGEKKKINYFTGIITMLAEEKLSNNSEVDFDPDPRGLIYLLNNGKIIGGSSRRFDGAYPSIYSPQLVWEIKEYYYTKSFGSRIADCVYESELDGYEFEEIYNRTGIKVHHVLFVDSHYTWWTLGKSYLTRLIDILNMRLVDDIIFGREVLTAWPEILQKYAKENP